MIVAAVLGRTYLRLASPSAGGRDESTEDDEETPPSGAETRVVTLLTSLVVVFVFVWAASGVAVSWQEVKLGTSLEQFQAALSETYVNLSALHSATYACGLGALVTLGALLMARAYDRLTGIR